MSTQGQGDGGVYKSILGGLVTNLSCPKGLMRMYACVSGLGSYKFGSKEYEELLIVDCFGLERLAEYKGRGNLNCLLVLKVHEVTGSRAVLSASRV
jgi:hypothetical protein